jgi:uncharacterized protein (UPF0335 family)
MADMADQMTDSSVMPAGAEISNDPVGGTTPGTTPGATPGTVGGIAGDILSAYIERIERLEEEKKNLGGDIREVYAEAKGNGFEPKIMRKLVALRRMDKADRVEEEELLDLYRRAIGV